MKKISRLINEIGNRYGLLKVVRCGDEYRTTKKWICLCDCGRKLASEVGSVGMAVCDGKSDALDACAESP